MHLTCLFLVSIIADGVHEEDRKPIELKCFRCGKKVDSRTRFRKIDSNLFGQIDLTCRECDRKVKKSKKKEDMNWEERKEVAGEKFKASMEDTPTHPCICCHRMLFRRSMVKFRRECYHSTSINVIRALEVGVICGEAEFICQTCHLNLKKEQMPVQAVANGLKLDDVPPFLRDLTTLELRCLSLRIPFMKIHALKKGGQGKIKGPCVNVPTTLKSICRVLPRVPEEMHLILLKLKRRLEYPSHHLYDFIRPKHVMRSLRWLKENNPYYRNVQIDHEWESKLMNDEIGDSINILDVNDKPVKSQRGQKRPNPNSGESNVETCCKKKKNEIDTTGVHVTEGVDVDMVDVEGSGSHQQNLEEDDEECSLKEQLEDAVFKEDQEEMQRKSTITVEPSSTCMQIDDIEEAVFSIAPGEQSKPKYILTDNDCEILSFPNMLPYGKCGYDVSCERVSKLHLRKYVNQRLLNHNPMFSQSTEYIFMMQYATELKQLGSDMQMALRRMKRHGVAITAGDLANTDFVRSMVDDNMAYRFMRNVRGTPAYWHAMLQDTMAMLRTFGTPTFFLTLSAAEHCWPEFIQAIGLRIGEKFTESDVEEMSWEQKSKLLRTNPVVVVQMFQHRLDSFFREYIFSDAEPVGKVYEHCIKIEFQARGSPHAHVLLWVKGAPRIDQEPDVAVEQFCEKYIQCELPKESDADLHGLVTKLQMHCHSSSCRKHPNAPCRFHFPRPAVWKSVVARKGSVEEEFAETKKMICSTVKDRIDKNKKEGKIQSMKEILEKEGIDQDDYLRCLMFSRKQSEIVMKRETTDVFVNNYNAGILKLWKANMDFQFVGDPMSAIMYVLSYMLKCEAGMSEVLRRAAKEFESEGVKEMMSGVAAQFKKNREVSVQEAIYRVLSIPLFKKSSTVLFLNNKTESKREKVPLPQSVLSAMDEDETDIFMKSIHDRYSCRPDCLEELCLAKFASDFKVKAKGSKANVEVFKLKNGMGEMVKRQKPVIIRTMRHKEGTTNFFFGMLLLFVPWRTENDLIDGYESYDEHYWKKVEDIQKNAALFNLDRKDIDDAYEEYMRGLREQGAERDKGESDKTYDETGAGDDFENATDQSESENKDVVCYLGELFKSEAAKLYISNPEYYSLMLKLNKEQKGFVMYVRRWVKENIRRMKDGKSPEGFKVFLCGAGGTGKSTIIKMIYRDVVRMFRCIFVVDPNDPMAFDITPEHPTCLLSAFTGTAAFNINGATLHSLFQLFNKTLADAKKCSMMTMLRNLQMLVIDEISMVKAVDFSKVNDRCAMIKQKDAGACNFGDLGCVFAGDLDQLFPVAGSSVFQCGPISSPDDMAKVNLWKDVRLHELTQVMRQKDDLQFAHLLGEVRKGRPDEGSTTDEALRRRELHVSEEEDGYPHDALHVYVTNADADGRNEKSIQRLPGKLYTCNSRDSCVSDKISIDKIRLSTKPNDTCNLRAVLLLKVGARVMMTNNIDVGDGLTNGSFGTVVEIRTKIVNNKEGCEHEEVHTVMVKFDSNKVGLKACRKTGMKDNRAVPIVRYCGEFGVKGRETVRVKRSQFPLMLAWAVTIHKVQGMTLPEVVVDMGKGTFKYGQAYVAFSRVTKYEKLHIINYNRHQIRKSPEVAREMERLRKQRLELPGKSIVIDQSDEKVNLCLLNVQGLMVRGWHKREDLVMDEDVQACDIVCLCETHLDDAFAFSAEDVWLAKKGKVAQRDRLRNQGGVAVVVSDMFSSMFHHGMSSVGGEDFVIVKSMHGNKCIRIILAYVPPRTNKQIAAGTLTQLVKKFKTANASDPLFVVGDFNENLNTGKGHICSSLEKEGMSQVVKSPTTDYGSTLDHVYCWGVSDVECEVRDCYFSDHDKVLVRFSIS